MGIVCSTVGYMTYSYNMLAGSMNMGDYMGDPDVAEDMRKK